MNCPQPLPQSTGNALAVAVRPPANAFTNWPETGLCSMENENLENVLKYELQALDNKLRKAETYGLAGWIGSMVGSGLVLSTMADQIPVIAAIAIGATFLNIMATRLVSRKK